MSYIPIVLKNIKKTLNDGLDNSNSSEAAIKLLRELDALDKYGYIISALDDDPLMLQVLAQDPVADWLLDEHKGELRESLEETLAHWFFDRSAIERDVEMASLFCLVTLDNHCQFRSSEKPVTGTSEELIFKCFDKTKRST